MTSTPPAPVDDIVVRPMTLADLPGADRLREQVGFNQRLDDWRNLLRWEPDRCYVAVASGTVVGTVTTTSFDRQLAWVGMLLVDEGHRRKAVGSRLLRTALDSVAEVACVALDATPAGRELYLRRGFRDRLLLTRWQGTVTATKEATRTVAVAALATSDLVEVLTLDRSVVGVGRARILTELATETSCWVARRSGRLVGFAMVRPGSHHHVLGPVLAEDDEAAHDLVSTALDRLVGCSVVVDVPDGSPGERCLEQRGLTRQRPLVRMSTTPLPSGPHESRYHAIASPEIG